MNPLSKRNLATGEVDLVGVTEVALRLKMTSERVRQLAKSGDMPDPFGRLGRQLVWRWTDIESWARAEERPLDSIDGGRQPVRNWKQGSAGSLTLIANEIFTWEGSPKNACHIRVWAPPQGSDDPHVVLLGQLENFNGRSVTNDIEMVAMAAAHKYLGTAWQRAQFYEYSPSSPFDDDDQFYHVTFAIKNSASRIWRTSGRRMKSAAVKVLGGEFVDPSWRRASREEIESLTGDTVQIWALGTYTRDLLTATLGSVGSRFELNWDPERSQDLVRIVLKLVAMGAQDLSLGIGNIFGFEVDISVEQIEMACVLVAQAAMAAKERAEQDVKTQPVDAAIWLNAPTFKSESVVFSLAERRLAMEIHHSEIWQLVSSLQSALVGHPDGESDTRLIEQRQLLVPGFRGGWVRLTWYQAGIDEPEPEREGYYGYVALPSDLTNTERDTSALEPFGEFLLLIDVLNTHLEEEHAQFWLEHNVPSFMPSVALPATGPITRSYLNAVDWKTKGEIERHRLARFEGIVEVERVGIDTDGFLVVLGIGGREFACEWPVSGHPDPTLTATTIRADRQSPHGGPVPVFIERPDGRLQLLSSSPAPYHGNSFTWGYSGTGPSNLAAATMDLLQRADASWPDSEESLEFLHVLANSPRVPNWRVDELLQYATNQERGKDKNSKYDSARLGLRE